MSDVRQEWYLLRNAVYSGDYEAAEGLLRDHPGLLHETNGIGETVLHFLAVEDCLPGIEWLHARGGSLNTTNEFGTPLLFEVAQLEYRELFLWLVQHGADLHARDANGNSLDEYLVEYERAKMVTFIAEHFPNS